MTIRYLLLACLISFSAKVFPGEPSMGPAIEGYGPTFPIADRDVPLRDEFIYKVVFDAGDNSRDTTSLNHELVSVARFLNMHARNGVPVVDMDIAVVLHGAALKSALTDAAYESRFETPNPNRELIMKLQDAGVAFYACGQSMAFGGIARHELLSPVKVGLSAMTMLTYLQSDSYALLP
jgi:intracellular sulfur oxidation DsrE/DsrF family protein